MTRHEQRTQAIPARDDQGLEQRPDVFVPVRAELELIGEGGRATVGAS